MTINNEKWKPLEVLIIFENFFSKITHYGNVFLNLYIFRKSKYLFEISSGSLIFQNIQKFMDAAKHGVIYLSFGSIMKPDKIERLGKIFIHIMENLPQKIIMKWDPNLLPYIPKNFLVLEWIPQVAVLSKKIQRNTSSNFHQKYRNSVSDW